jgi:hypothetical protein
MKDLAIQLFTQVSDLEIMPFEHKLDMTCNLLIL